MGKTCMGDNNTKQQPENRSEPEKIRPSLACVIIIISGCVRCWRCRIYLHALQLKSLCQCSSAIFLPDPRMNIRTSTDAQATDNVHTCIICISDLVCSDLNFIVIANEHIVLIHCRYFTYVTLMVLLFNGIFHQRKTNPRARSESCCVDGKQQSENTHSLADSNNTHMRCCVRY